MAVLFEEFDDMESEETSSAGNECAHIVVSHEKESIFLCQFSGKYP